jgi:hypothetical protein
MSEEVQATQAPMTEEQLQKQAHQQYLNAVMAAVAEFDNAPTKEQIADWKKASDIFAIGLDEGELYIWRPISRREYKGLKKAMQAKAQSGGEIQDGDFEEEVVKLCLLWGSDYSFLDSKGGGFDLLAEQILLRSNFVNTQAAAQMVIKL